MWEPGVTSCPSLRDFCRERALPTPPKNIGGGGAALRLLFGVENVHIHYRGAPCFGGGEEMASPESASLAAQCHLQTSQNYIQTSQFTLTLSFFSPHTQLGYKTRKKQTNKRIKVIYGHVPALNRHLSSLCPKSCYHKTNDSSDNCMSGCSQGFSQETASQITGPLGLLLTKSNDLLAAS